MITTTVHWDQLRVHQMKARRRHFQPLLRDLGNAWRIGLPKK